MCVSVTPHPHPTHIYIDTSQRGLLEGDAWLLCEGRGAPSLDPTPQTFRTHGGLLYPLLGGSARFFGFSQPPGACTGWGGSVSLWGAIISHKSPPGPWVPIYIAEIRHLEPSFSGQGVVTGLLSRTPYFGETLNPRSQHFQIRIPRNQEASTGWAGQRWCLGQRLEPPPALPPSSSPFLPHPTPPHLEGRQRELIYKSHTWGRSWRISSALCRPGPALQPSPLPSPCG